MAKTKKEEPIEKVLWATANKLRKNIDAAEYKHVVLGLIFLRYISDSFESLYNKLEAGEGEYAGADPEDKDEYKAENVFFVPQNARWNYLKDNAKNPEIGKLVDAAMDEIEKENPRLKGVLPKVYARGNLDVNNLGGLIDLISNISLGESQERTSDLLGHVFEYFLGEFALAEGKKGGQFYTPRSIVELLVEMLEPYKGRVMDPCCGSGGMFVQSEKFVLEHQGKMSDISVYGQESNQTTWRLAKMNLAIRGIDSTQVKWNNEGSFLNNEHKDVKVDYIIANPPFNDDDWSGELLRNDARWAYGVPPASNANYAWIQHFLFHLAPSGRAGFVLGNSSLSAIHTGEHKVRESIIEANLVECIVALPKQLFFNTSIPACLWFISRNKPRDSKTLLIDARKLGVSISASRNELTNTDIRVIADTYHNWRNDTGYSDVPGYCKEITLEDIRQHKYNLSPNKYIDLPEDEDENISLSEFISKHLTRLTPEQQLKRDLAEKVAHSLKENGYKELAELDYSLIGRSDLLSILHGLYEDWFVNFDLPEKFRAQANNRRDKNDYVNFPHSWDVQKLSDVADIVDCLHSKKPSEIDSGENILLQVFNISDDGLLDAKKTYRISEEDYKSWTRNIEVEEGDCIITNTGRVGAVAQIPFGQKFAIGRNITAVRPKEGELLPSYLINFLLSYHMKVQTYRQTDIGTILDSLNVKGIKEIDILTPPMEIQEAFDEFAYPLRRLVELTVNTNSLARQPENQPV